MQPPAEYAEDSSRRRPHAGGEGGGCTPPTRQGRTEKGSVLEYSSIYFFMQAAYFGNVIRMLKLLAGYCGAQRRNREAAADASTGAQGVQSASHAGESLFFFPLYPISLALLFFPHLPFVLYFSCLLDDHLNL
jgi:hypothetical protein